MSKTITVIPATIDIHNAAPLTETRKRRVAGYARVSTEADTRQGQPFLPHPKSHQKL
jgi:hypothetical protein